MDTNEEYGKRGDGGQGNHPQQYYNFTECPPYDFYQQGVTEAKKGWLEVFIASIRNTSGRYLLVTIVSVWALSKIAYEFLEKGSNNLSYKSIIGTLLITSMIFVIGLVSLWRIEKTDAGQEEDRKKDKNESAESGSCRKGPFQNRRPSTRNRGTDANGGGG
jgi:phage terminase large subunit-like protein